MFLFAEYIEELFFTMSGAKFQILAASLMNVEFRTFPPRASTNWLISADLVLLSRVISFLLVTTKAPEVESHFLKGNTNWEGGIKCL